MLIHGAEEVMGHHDFEEPVAIFRRIRIGYNLRMLTLLTAARAYLEQIPQLVGSAFKDADKIKAKIKSNLANVFDGSFEYRVIDSLRNYAQHASLPLGGFSIRSENLRPSGGFSSDEPSRGRMVIEPYFEADGLTNSEKIRKKTREEIAALGFRKLDAKYFVRKYISDLSRHHSFLMELLTEQFNESVETIGKATSKLEKEKSGEVKYHAIFSKSDGKILEERNMHGKFYTRPIGSGRNTKRLHNLSRMAVSSEIAKKKDLYQGDDPTLWLPD